jgi:hypothetical protein
MFDLFRLWFGALVRTLRSRRGLILESLALRQQLVVLKRKHTQPRLTIVGTIGSSVTITGSNFGPTQGTVKFNGALAASVASWSSAQIIATVPAEFRLERGQSRLP